MAWDGLPSSGSEFLLLASDTWSQWLYYPRKRNTASHSQFLNYECPQKSLGARSCFAICVCCQTKCLMMLSSWWQNNVCSWQNICAYQPPFCKTQPFMHVSRWVLVESLLLLFILGSHPLMERILVFSYVDLQISHGIWNEYCSFSWSNLVANFKVFRLKKCPIILFCYIDWNFFVC